MTTTRRRVLRPVPPSAAENLVETRRIAKARQQLTKERAALRKWWSKLKRAFTTVEKIQKRIVRLNVTASVSTE